MGQPLPPPGAHPNKHQFNEGGTFPQQVPPVAPQPTQSYPPQGSGYPPQAPNYPPQAPNYPPQGPNYPPQGQRGPAQPGQAAPYPQQNAAGQLPVSDKSMGIATILLLLLGALGIHNFYVGHNKQGFIELGAGIVVIIVSIVTSFLFGGGVSFLLPALYGVFLIVELVFVWQRTAWWKTDGAGLPLKQGF